MLAPCTHLFHGQYLILSQEGPQGDPLGSLLLNITIQPLLDCLISELTLGYLDDLTVGDDQTKVAADVLRIKELGESIGLSLNLSMCELVCNLSTDIVDPLLTISAVFRTVF